MKNYALRIIMRYIPEQQNQMLGNPVLQNMHFIFLAGDFNERGWLFEGHQHPSTVTNKYVNTVPSFVLQRRKKPSFRGRDNGVYHLKFLFVALIG
jgi:hypothetical protein